MVRGVIHLLGARQIVLLNPELAPSWRDLLMDDRGLSRFPLVEIPGPLNYFTFDVRQGDVLLVLGADVIDGTCGFQPSLERLLLIRKAISTGARTLIFCSFRSDVDSAITELIRECDQAIFLLRDSISLANFERLTGKVGVYFPDLYRFCPEEDSGALRLYRHNILKASQSGKISVGLNFSEHSFRSFYDRHTIEARREYVDRVLRGVVKVVPNIFPVLLSNDRRSWENFPSDDFYQQLCAKWFSDHGFAHNILQIDPCVTYPEYLSLLRSLDILISGRMHLALAAFKSRVLPIVMMGQGKGYTSNEKMRGAFLDHVGSDDQVVSDIERLPNIIENVLRQKERLKARLSAKLAGFDTQDGVWRSQFDRYVGCQALKTSGANVAGMDGTVERRDYQWSWLARLSQFVFKRRVNVDAGSLTLATNVDSIDNQRTTPSGDDSSRGHCSSWGCRLVPLEQGGLVASRWYRGSNVEAKVCENCAYVCFEPPGEAELSEYYSKDYNENAGVWYNLKEDYARPKVSSRADDVQRVLRRYIKKDDPVIFEIGCAFGGTVHELRRRGVSAFGADLNADAISQGRSHGNEYIFSDFVHHVAGEHGMLVNLIYSYHALEHIPDIVGFLRQIRPSLDEDAVLEFRVPNGAYLRAWRKGFEAWDWFAYPDHLHMLTPHSVVCVAREAGFELLEISSSACGESAESIRSWLNEGAHWMPDPTLVSQLEQALMLQELRFVLTPKGSLTAGRFSLEIESLRRRFAYFSSHEASIKVQSCMVGRGQHKPEVNDGNRTR